MHLHDLTESEDSITPEEIEALYSMANVTELEVPFLVEDEDDGYRITLVALPETSKAHLELSRNELRSSFDPPGPIRVIRRFRRGMVDLVNLWTTFRLLNCDADGRLEAEFLNFPVGTPRVDVVAWFAEQNPDFDAVEMEDGAYAVSVSAGLSQSRLDLTVAVADICNMQRLFGKAGPATLRQAREMFGQPEDPLQEACCRILDKAIDDILTKRLFRDRLGEIFPMGFAPEPPSLGFSLNW